MKKQTNRSPDLVTNQLPLLLIVIGTKKANFVWRKIHRILDKKEVT